MRGAEAEALRQLCGWLEARYGLHFPEQQMGVLAKKLMRALKGLALASFDEARRAAEHNADTAQQIVRALTIGETYFFRNRAQFEALRREVLPALCARLAPAASLNVWSAGCATGEEPYSIAMWIREHAPQLWPNRLRIIATDINTHFLTQARRGLYRRWSFRGVEPYWQQRCFTAEGDAHRIDPAIQKVVRFESHNLANRALPHAVAPGQVDLIMCRNVLIYFGPQAAQQVLGSFDTALAPEGVLFLGHAESMAALRKWRASYLPGTFCYQPQRERPPAPAPAGQRSESPSTCQPPRTTAAAALVAQPTTSDPGAGEPDPVQTLGQARRAADAGELEQAKQQLADFMAADRTSVEAYLLSAIVSDQLGDTMASRKALKRALYLDKRSALGHYLLAVLDERDGDERGALRHYRTVNRLLEQSAPGLEIAFGDGLTAEQLLELTGSRVEELAQGN